MELRPPKPWSTNHNKDTTLTTQFLCNSGYLLEGFPVAFQHQEGENQHICSKLEGWVERDPWYSNDVSNCQAMDVQNSWVGGNLFSLTPSHLVLVVVGHGPYRSGMDASATSGFSATYFTPIIDPIKTRTKIHFTLQHFKVFLLYFPSFVNQSSPSRPSVAVGVNIGFKTLLSRLSQALMWPMWPHPAPSWRSIVPQLSPRCGTPQDTNRDLD